MNRKQAEQKLAELGYEIDWSCTGPSEGYWSGTIDAMGRGQIDGDCRGETVTGDNASDWYRNAVKQASGYSRQTRCANPDCEFHADHPLTQ